MIFWCPARIRLGPGDLRPFKAVDELLNDRLDALAVQFKESQPAFFNAYNTARVIVDSPGGRTSKDATTAPISKAA